MIELPPATCEAPAPASCDMPENWASRARRIDPRLSWSGGPGDWYLVFRFDLQSGPTFTVRFDSYAAQDLERERNASPHVELAACEYTTS